MKLELCSIFFSKGVCVYLEELGICGLVYMFKYNRNLGVRIYKGCRLGGIGLVLVLLALLGVGRFYFWGFRYLCCGVGVYIILFLKFFLFLKVFDL